jgi:hypothetical protein
MPKFRTSRQKGEWAEQVLVLRVMEMELNPSRPISASLAYDHMVENPKRGTAKRIQVKSTASQGRYGEYSVTIARSPRWHAKQGYTAREVDLIAVYVIPENAWYIIPVRALRGRVEIRLRPQGPGRMTRYEKYREAWHLMF